MVRWYGSKVVKDTTELVCRALGEIGLEVEKHAKAHLWPGHGVDTGSMQRSIHTARPGHNWSGEHEYPNGPERGGRFNAAVVLFDRRAHLEVGSPQRYSLIVHQKWYRFMRVGLQRAIAVIPTIMGRYSLR